MSLNWSVNKPLKQRERFASPLAILAIVAAGLLLLVMLYPEKSLRKLLSAPLVTSPAQQHYLEILVHLRNGDADLVFTLTRSYLAAKKTEKAVQALTHLTGALTPEEKKTARQLRYEVALQLLKSLRRDDKRWTAAQDDYGALVESYLQDGATPAELERYQADAGLAGDWSTYQKLLALRQERIARASGAAMGHNQAAITAEDALSRRDYRGAAALHFQTMNKSPQSQKRQHFLAGVRALQSGNLLQEALNAAEKHLGSLSGDRETLMYLSRLALAANRPALAQHYIRLALGLTDTAKDPT